MASPNPKGPQFLADEILAEGRGESEEIMRRAQTEAESLLGRAAAEAARLRQERLSQAQAEAAYRTELILATIPMEADRLRSDRVEFLLQSVFNEAHARLSALDGPGYRESLITLAAEATSQMDGASFTVQLSAADYTRFGAGLAEEIVRRAGRSPLSVTLSVEPALRGAGLVVRAADARQVWDNCFERRLERLWPELRRQLALQAGLVRANGSMGSSI